MDASSINYSTLTFGEYEIVANQINKIPVNYNGASGTIEVFGVSNAITSIYAEYIGKGLTVDSVLTIDDISVHAVNTNGQITDIKDGVLIENGIIYNVGENTATLHYGSLSCTIVVTGVAATDITKTPEPAKDKPVAMETPVPVATSEPVVTVSTGGTVNSNPTIQTSDIPSSVVNVATSSMVVSSNIIGIKLTDKVEYKVLTNKNVVITIIPGNATNIKYQVVKKGTNVSDTAWKVVADNKITVKSAAKPSVVYIQYTDINGVVQTALTTGFTIDKKKAAVNVKSGKTYKKGKKITFKDANGIKIAKLDGKVIKTGKKVIKKGSHTLVVTDKAGNKKTVKLKIK